MKTVKSLIVGLIMGTMIVGTGVLAAEALTEVKTECESYFIVAEKCTQSMGWVWEN